VVCFFILSSSPPLIWGAATFSILIHFWRLLVCQKRQDEGFKLCFDTKNNKALPLDPAHSGCLSVRSRAGLPYECKAWQGEGKKGKVEPEGKTCRSSLVLTALATMGKCNDRELISFRQFIVQPVHYALRECDQESRPG